MIDIVMQGTQLDLTDDLRAFTEEKLNDALRALGDTRHDPLTVNVELERTTRRRQQADDLYRAEVNLKVPGRLLRAEASDSDIRSAVVEMKRILKRDIRRWREKMIDQRRQGGRDMKREQGDARFAEEPGITTTQPGDELASDPPSGPPTDDDDLPDLDGDVNLPG